MRSLYLLVFLVACSKKPEAKIQFSETFKKFAINRGEKFTTKFEFINSGDDSLRIKSVHASCGCIVIKYPEYSVAPDSKGEIMVTYDSNVNKSEGIVDNDILIESNTEPILHRLSIQGDVRKMVFDRL